MLCHGWLPQSPHLLPLCQHFLYILDTNAQLSRPEALSAQVQYVDLFMPQKRTRVQWTGLTFWPVSCGAVPTDQSQKRIDGGVDQRKPCRLWFDNEIVFNMLYAWLHGEQPSWVSQPDTDLWHNLAEIQACSPVYPHDPQGPSPCRQCSSRCPCDSSPNDSSSALLDNFASSACSSPDHATCRLTGFPNANCITGTTGHSVG